MDYLFNPLTPLPQESDLTKGLTDDERLKVVLCQVGGYLLAFIVFIAICVLCALFTSCASPRVVEQHHHHHYEADTAAVHAQVDRQLTSWHEQMTQFFQQRLEEYSSEWSSHEDQKETITELITETTDSLGRKVRQEQRTISRDITRELQQQEQRLTREYEARMHAVIDSVSDTWHHRYDSLSAHVSQLDSLSKSVQIGSADLKPWYQRWWDNIRFVLIAALVAAVLWFTRSLWWPLLKRIFKRDSC